MILLKISILTVTGTLPIVLALRVQPVLLDLRVLPVLTVLLV